MSAATTFKALDFDLRTYGFWPPDFLAAFFMTALTIGLFGRLDLDVAVAAPAFYLAWRGRRRPSYYLRSLYFFAAAPPRYPVGLRRESITR